MYYTVLFDSLEMTFLSSWHHHSLLFPIWRRVSPKRGQTGMGQARPKATEESDRWGGRDPVTAH